MSIQDEMENLNQVADLIEGGLISWANRNYEDERSPQLLANLMALSRPSIEWKALSNSIEMRSAL